MPSGPTSRSEMHIVDNTTSQILSTHSVGATVQVVIDTLFARIKAGSYPVDTRLPSERTLASELGVSRNTVREALDVLEAQNIIQRRAGSGSFVKFRSGPKPLSLIHLSEPTRPN